MDVLVEEEEQMAPGSSWTMVNPFTLVLSFLSAYGWYLVGVGVAGLCAWGRLRPKYEQWKQAREDAEYHKDPDKALARMEAIQRARERQQREIEELSARAVEREKEREEKKRLEAAERLKRYESEGGARRLGTPQDGDYLPLSGGASGSNYKAPKRSACSRGGCGG